MNDLPFYVHLLKQTFGCYRLFGATPQQKVHPVFESNPAEILSKKEREILQRKQFYKAKMPIANWS